MEKQVTDGFPDNGQFGYTNEESGNDAVQDQANAQ